MTSAMLAFGHTSRVGKDTCVNEVVRFLREQLDLTVELPYSTVEKRSFFSSGKDAAYEIFKCYGLRPWEFYDSEENQHLRDVPLLGCNLTPMQIWIGFGDKVRQIYQSCFADRAVFGLPVREFTVFTSLRFPEEAAAVRRAGGWCVKVERVPAPELRALDKQMPSDYPWDRVIVNDGTIEMLKEKAVGVLNDYLEHLNGPSAVV